MRRSLLPTVGSAAKALARTVLELCIQLLVFPAFGMSAVPVREVIFGTAVTLTPLSGGGALRRPFGARQHGRTDAEVGLGAAATAKG